MTGRDEVPPELKQLLDKHTAALQTGDPAQIAASSHVLVAVGLRLIADLRFKEGSFADSIQAYRQSLELQDSPQSRLGLAETQIEVGQLDDALSQTERVLRQNPKDVQAWRVQARVYRARANYPGEIDALERALEISPDSDVRYSLGVAFLKSGQKQKADAVFQRMIETNGDRAAYHILFGDAYRDSQDYPDSIRELKRAIALDPSASHAHFFLGYTYLAQSRYVPNQDSAREFSEEVRRYPADFFGNFYLGVIESSLKLFGESSRHLKAAATANPARMETWLYLGLNAYQQNDFPNAKAHFLRAIALAEDNARQSDYQIHRAYTSLGRILALQGKRDEAARYVRRAREMESRALQDAQDDRGMQQQGMGQGPGVLARMPKPPLPEVTPVVAPGPKASVTQLRRLLAGALNDWGTSEARQELFGQALIHFHEAERWDASVPGLMRNIGMAAIRVEGYSEAVRTLTVAVEQNPGDRLARSMLAVALFSLNRYQDAAKQFNAVGDQAMNDPRMAYAWAFSLSQVNQPRESGAVLGKLTARALPADLFLLSGQVYGANGDHEHAVECFRKAAAADPAIRRAHYNAGLALIRLDRPTDAIPEFQAELKLTPEDPEAKYHLAFALLQASHPAEAVALFRSVLEKHPDHAAAQYQLGKELLDEGSVEESIQHLAAAAQLDPDKDYIRYQLQTAYRRAGRKADADRELKVYQDIKNKARGRPTTAH